MLKEDHKINNLQQLVSSAAILIGAGILCLGAYFGVQQATKPSSGPELASFQGDKDLIVARVNGHEIRLSEVVMARAEISPESAHLPEPLVLETIINDLIDRRLFAEAGWKAGLTRDDTIQGRIQFEQEKLLRDHYIASLIEERVSDRDIKQLYTERYLNTDFLREVHLFQILVRSPEEAGEVMEGLEQDIPFSDLARQYSIDAFAVTGGDMGYVSADSLLEAVSNHAFAAEEGTLTGPFQSSFGWHILYIQDHRQKEPLPLIAVRDELRQELLEKAMLEELARLRNTARIERVQPPMQAELDSAMIAAQ